MIRCMAVFTFVLIVGVCSYVVLNPGSYSSLVLCLAERKIILCRGNQLDPSGLTIGFMPLCAKISR